MAVPDATQALIGRAVLESAIRLAIVALLVVFCLRIAAPFIPPILWGIVIAVALHPLFLRLTRLVGGRTKLAATIFTLFSLAVVLIPTIEVVESLVDTGKNLSARVEGGDRPAIPSPPDRVRAWPLLGESLYSAWSLANRDLEGAVQRYEKQLRTAVSAVAALISGASAALVQSILALVFAGLLLATADSGRATAYAIGRRLSDEVGERIVGICGATIGSVAKGVLGVALVQGLLAGLALFLAGVPAAGLWTLVVMVLAVVQLPPILVLGPICVWVFGNVDSKTIATVFTVWSVVVSGADGFLKPIFLGRGVAIPMPVILIGAIGGMMSMGILGLFLGAVILATGYSLLQVWLAAGGADEQAVDEGAIPEKIGTASGNVATIRE